MTVQLPPLRERAGAIPLLVDHFLRKFAEQYRKDAKQLSSETMEVFAKYHWPGNVRELENMVRRMIVLGNEQAVLQEIALRGDHHGPREDPEEFLDLEALGSDLANGRGVDLKGLSKRAARIAEKRVIERVLRQTRWNRKEAAERLQISYKALLYKMKESGLNDDR